MQYVTGSSVDTVLVARLGMVTAARVCRGFAVLPQVEICFAPLTGFGYYPPGCTARPGHDVRLDMWQQAYLHFACHQLGAPQARQDLATIYSMPGVGSW